jgi:glucose-1-phosphate adenylyltransferase
MTVPRPRNVLTRHALAVVLAGGRGSRLHQLTQRRAKPAVHFGGTYRIIDFALSNCVNAGIRRIGIATQYKAHSLIRHLQRGWTFFRAERGESFDILPASQRIDETRWYQGTADAVYQNIDILGSPRPEHILVLAGDHVYKMDYGRMLEAHVETGAEVTVGCIEVPRTDATGFGVMDVDASGRIVHFLEKPADPPGMPDRPDMALASMGIYVFETGFLFDQLARDADDRGSSHDFGKDVIPHLVPRAKVMAHRFAESCVRSLHEPEPYWRDVGTVDAYYESNIDLTRPRPALDLADPDWPIWTYPELAPPARLVHDGNGSQGSAAGSLVCNGCVIEGGRVQGSLLSTRVEVASGALVEGSVVLPSVRIGEGARLRRVVVDRGVQVPGGLVVGEDPDADRQRFHRSPAGVTLITRPMIEALDDAGES